MAGIAFTLGHYFVAPAGRRRRVPDQEHIRISRASWSRESLLPKQSKGPPGGCAPIIVGGFLPPACRVIAFAAKHLPLARSKLVLRHDAPFQAHARDRGAAKVFAPTSRNCSCQCSRRNDVIMSHAVRMDRNCFGSRCLSRTGRSQPSQASGSVVRRKKCACFPNHLPRRS